MVDPLTDRLSALLGMPVSAARPLGGGTFGAPYAVTLADGVQLFAKLSDRPTGRRTPPSPGLEPPGLRWTGTLPDDDAPLTIITSEARSLLTLAGAVESGGARVPRLVGVTDDVLVTELLPQGSPTRAAAAAFGTALARTHRFGSPRFGAAVELYLASELLPTGDGCEDWPTFHATARLLPFLARAEAAAGIGGADADDVRRVVDRLPALAGPPEYPALLHGDLWSGNVLWTGGPGGVVMIDPAAYGGHRETDLAMLALFGLPHLETVLAGYHTEFPLAPGWQDRVALHQVFPLLVHALLFGGSYGPATGDAARRALAG